LDGRNTVTIIKHDFQAEKHVASKGDEKTKKIPGYQLRIDLDYSSPTISRIVRVPGTLTLHALHAVMQICYGWNDDATYRFLVGKVFYGPNSSEVSNNIFNASEVQLHELEKGMGFIFAYIYDGGNGWECEITLEAILPADDEVPYPQLLNAYQGRLPASFDDIHEYQEFLGILQDSATDRASVLAMHNLADNYDPAFCDIESLKRQLKLVS
jgi:hypothetical protein